MKVTILFMFIFIGNICNAAITNIVCTTIEEPRSTGIKKFNISEDIKILTEDNQSFRDFLKDGSKLADFLKNSSVDYSDFTFRNTRVDGDMYFYERVYPNDWNLVSFKLSLNIKNGRMKYTIIYPADESRTSNSKLEFLKRKPITTEQEYSCG